MSPNSGIESKTNTPKKWNHVYAVMEIMLYLNERKLPYKIKGVEFKTKRKFVIDGLWPITVTQDEFDEIYAAVKPLNLPRNEMIQQLGDRWIQQNNYKAWTLPN